MGKDRRQHLHRQIGSHGCDVTHVTERIGSPQTLVCTKTRASYQRKKVEFAVNVQLLAELRPAGRPESSPYLDDDDGRSRLESEMQEVGGRRGCVAACRRF